VAYLFVHEDREYLLEPGERFESDLGILEVPETVDPGDVVETHLGTAFTVRRLRGPDLFTHLERTGAPMMPHGTWGWSSARPVWPRATGYWTRGPAPASSAPTWAGWVPTW
jgi:hypothetical protein